MRWRRIFSRGRWDDERARELDAHLAIETDDNIARGMTPAQAASAARRKLGNLTRIREEIYDMNTVSTFETARLDLRDALRQLRRRPLVTILGFLLLTIGLGASAAAFSVAYGVFVRPLPYPEANRLAALWEGVQGRRGQLSYPDFQDIRQTAPFEAAVAFGSGRGTLTTAADADRVNTVDGEAGLLPLLGARPLLGRLIEPSDEGRPVTVISRRLWQTVFHGDASIVGHPVGLSGTTYTIVGVASGLDFEFPVGGSSIGSGFTIKDVDMWMPLNAREPVARNRAVSTYQAIVKLKPGQALESAQHAIDVVASNLARAYPSTNRSRGFQLTPLHDQIVEARSAAVWTGFGGAMVILIIACANLASLFLGELPERRRDLALREALGASRGRLLRQLALETLVLSSASAIVGAVVARGLVASFKRAADLPRLEAIRFDLPVLAAVAVAAFLVGLIARLAPLGRLGPARGALRPTAARYTTSAPLVRRTLVVVQLALAVVLSSAALLLAVSFRHIVLVDPGFAPAHALTARVSAFAARYPAQADVARFVNDLVVRLAGRPDVQASAASSAMPLAGNSVGTAVGVAGRLVPMAERPSAGWQTVTPGYFATLGIPLVSGRDFAPPDLERPAHLTVINQALARRLFGDDNPIGRRLAFGGAEPVTDWHEVMGVVGDVRHSSLAEAAAPRAYDLYGQHWARTVYVVVRGSADPFALAPAVRAAVRELDPQAPVFEMQSLEDIVGATVAPRRLATGFAAATAGVSLMLAAIGLYGLLASSVAARTREFGIRRALGSSTSAIVHLVFGEAAVMSVVGAAMGIAAALVAGRVLQAQLFAVSATDARIVAATALVLALVGAAATVVPARRAAAVDPAIALRHE